MGSFVSSLLGGGGEPIGKEPESSRVICYDSSDRWKQHHEESKHSSKLIVVDFSASWCGPCKMMAPIFREMADKYVQVEFIRIDVDELPDVAKEFGIEAMPTFLFLKKGKEIDRLIGAKKDELESLISKYIKKNDG